MSNENSKIAGFPVRTALLLALALPGAALVSGCNKPAEEPPAAPAESTPPPAETSPPPADTAPPPATEPTTTPPQADPNAPPATEPATPPANDEAPKSGS